MIYNKIFVSLHQERFEGFTMKDVQSLLGKKSKGENILSLGKVNKVITETSYSAFSNCFVNVFAHLAIALSLI